MGRSIFDEVSGMGLGLRDTVILVQAGIEYHVNLIMLERFGTDSFESERMNSKLMALNDAGIIDDRLRQDLIQIARIRHLFAHSLDAGEAEFLALLRGIKNGADSAGGLRERFLAATRRSFLSIMEKQRSLSQQP